MRHLFFILILILCSVGRSEEDFNFNYGVEGGVNVSNIIPASNGDTDNKLGVVAGIYYELFPANIFSLLTGGYLVGKGASKPSTNQRLVLNYVQLRFLGRLAFYRTQSSKAFLDFGGGGDLITQKGTRNFLISPNLDSFINDFDISLIAGLGYERAITKDFTLAFNIKYHYGLINLYKPITIDSHVSIVPTAHSHGIMVTTAIQFSTERQSVGRSDEDLNYNYGMEGGVNISFSNTNRDNKLGAVAGLYWEFFPADIFSFLTGGYLVGKGYSEPATNQRLVLNYVQLRFLGRLAFYRTQSSRAFLDFGGGGDFITQNYPVFSNSDLFINDFDTSLIAGLGYERAITKDFTLAFNIKYHYGLISLLKTIATPTTLHSHGIMVTTAIQFSNERESVATTGDSAKDFLNRTK